MKKLFISLLLAAASGFIAQAQSWHHDTIEFEGGTRTFKTYHANTNQQDMAVVIMLHGLGGSMDDVDFTSLKAIADTANLLLVSPQALDFTHPLIGNLGPSWNSGIKVTGTPLGDIELNPNVNDVGFLKSLLDTVKANFSINENRIYLAGFSNGAFMTQRMLCEQPNLFSAAASHSGTKALPLTQCSNMPIPVAHFHGTTDEVVDINGNFYFMGNSAVVGISADSLISYWRSINNAGIPAVESTIGSQAAANYVTHYAYAGDKRVEFFKIANGMHQWYNFSHTNGAFDLGLETWHFFLRTQDASVGIRASNSVELVGTYPNPVSNTLYIDAPMNQLAQVLIIDPTGRIMIQQALGHSVDVRNLPAGIYILQLKDAGGKTKISKFVKN